MENKPAQPSKVNEDLIRMIQGLLSDRPIAYHACLARALKSATAGILLSQLLYWAPRTQNGDAWFYKTQAEIEEETALGRHEQDTARTKLRDAQVIEEKLAGVPARRHFRIRYDKLAELLLQYQPPKGHHDPPLSPSSGGSATGAGVAHIGATPQTSLPESGKLEWRKPANWNDGNRQTITETTAESTTESTSSKSLRSSEISPSNRIGTSKKIREEREEEPALDHRAESPTKDFATAGELLKQRYQPSVPAEQPDTSVASSELPPVQALRRRRRSAATTSPETADQQVIRAYIRDLRRRFQDFANETSSATRAFHLYEQARDSRVGLDIGTFTGYLEQAASVTKDRGGELRYFFSVLESLLWPEEHRAQRASGATASRRRRKTIGGPMTRVVPLRYEADKEADATDLPEGAKIAPKRGRKALDRVEQYDSSP